MAAVTGCLQLLEILESPIILLMLLEKFITSSVTFVQAANINDKNCSLFTVLTALHRKLTKSEMSYYSASCCHLGNVIMVISPFYDFCIF